MKIKISYHTVFFFIYGLIAFNIFSFASTPPDQPIPSNDLTIIQELVSVTNTDTDFLSAKLAIDKIIDPSVNEADVTKQVEQMVIDVQAMLGDNPTELEIVLALRKYLYDAGEWNDFKPFSYDMNDPLGKSPTSRLLHNYLRTRKGNCVSMPILHAILGRKLGLDMTLSTAPEHIFVKFKNNTGGIVNIEATSGGYPSRDLWYQQTMPMTKQALENGVYLKSLSDTQSIAIMAHSVLEYYNKNKMFNDMIELSQFLISQNESDATANVYLGQAYGGIIQKEFKETKPNQYSVSPEKQGHFQFLAEQSDKAFFQAESLGWRPPLDRNFAKEQEDQKRLERLAKQPALIHLPPHTPP